VAHLRPNIDRLHQLGHLGWKFAHTDPMTYGAFFDLRLMLAVTSNRSGGTSNTWRFSTATLSTSSKEIRQWRQSFTSWRSICSGCDAIFNVLPVCQACPPLFLPRLCLRLLGFSISPSLEGGFPLLLLFFASRSSSAWSRSSKFRTRLTTNCTVVSSLYW
jgi:hypothetical protein